MPIRRTNNSTSKLPVSSAKCLLDGLWIDMSGTTLQLMLAVSLQLLSNVVCKIVRSAFGRNNRMRSAPL